MSPLHFASSENFVAMRQIEASLRASERLLKNSMRPLKKRSTLHQKHSIFHDFCRDIGDRLLMHAE
jgi:hypothetical protein